MKFETRISSIRRHAWKQCRSCSADSDSKWPDSLARCALAGWIRSPRASSTDVTGCCASQSISRSGCSLRSSSAIATSRCAWPRPIGDETNSARLRRPSAAAPEGGGRQRAGEVAEQQVDLHRVARLRQVARSLERDERAAGRLRERGALRVRTDQVGVAVDHEHRTPDAGAGVAEALEPAERDRATRVGERLGVGLQRPADGSPRSASSSAAR